MKKNANFYLRTAATLSMAVAMLFGAALFTGCEDEDEIQKVVPELTVTHTPSLANVSAGSLTSTVTVTSNVAWTVTKTGDFINLSATAGTGDGSFVITVTENTTTDTRAGKVTVTAGELTKEIAVSQAAFVPELTVDETLLTFTTAAGAQTVTVTSNVEWTAEATAGDDFITVTTEGNILTVAVTENEGTDPREGTITVTAGELTKEIPVTQAGVAPALTVDKDAVPFLTADAASQTVTVISNVEWAASVTAGTFISVTTEGNIFSVTVTENEGADPRQGTVTVTGTGLAPKEIAVTQAGTQFTPIITVTSTKEITAAYSGKNEPVTIVANVEWTAAVTKGETFITLDPSPATGTNEGGFNVIIAANASTDTREGTITVTGTGENSNLSEQITVSQAAFVPELTVDETLLTFTTAAGAQTVTVTSNVEWTAEATAGDDFITVTTEGNILTVAVTENEGTDPRQGTVTVTAGELTKEIPVTQAGVAPALTVDKDAVPFLTADAASQTVTVTSNVEWTATATEGGDFITISEETGTNGNGSFKVTVSANTSTATRNGKVTVTGGEIIKNITVTQAGAPLTATLTVTDPAGPGYTITKEADLFGAYTISLSSNAGNDDVIGVVTSKTPDTDWIEVGGGGKAQGLTKGTEGAGQIRGRIKSANEAYQARVATITITANGDIGEPVVVNVTVIQKGIGGSTDPNEPDPAPAPYLEIGGLRWMKYNQVAAGEMPTGVTLGTKIADYTNACPTDWRLASADEWKSTFSNNDSHYSYHDEQNSYPAMVNGVPGRYMINGANGQKADNNATLDNNLFVPYSTENDIFYALASDSDPVGFKMQKNGEWFGGDGTGGEKIVRCVQTILTDVSGTPYLVIGNLKWLKFNQAVAGQMPTEVTVGEKFDRTSQSCPDGWRLATKVEWETFLNDGSYHDEQNSYPAMVNGVPGRYLKKGANGNVGNGEATFNNNLFIPYSTTEQIFYQTSDGSIQMNTGGNWWGNGGDSTNGIFRCVQDN